LENGTSSRCASTTWAGSISELSRTCSLFEDSDCANTRESLPMLNAANRMTDAPLRINQRRAARIMTPAIRSHSQYPFDEGTGWGATGAPVMLMSMVPNVSVIILGENDLY